MKCIIVDDEATARAVVLQLCNMHEDLEVLEEFSSAIEAIKFLNHDSVDLIFLDIHMPGFSGFDFIETLKDPPKIILTTSDPKFAIQAFEYDCIFDYLVKPIQQDRFEKAVNRAQVNFLDAKTDTTEKTQENFENELYVNIDRRLIKIEIASINLVEAKGDYIHIKTADKNYTVHSTLKKIEEKLPDTIFLKVHRSFIINIHRIIDIEDNSVLIKKDVIPVSRAHRPELMKRLNLL